MCYLKSPAAAAFFNDSATHTTIHIHIHIHNNNNTDTQRIHIHTFTHSHTTGKKEGVSAEAQRPTAERRAAAGPDGCGAAHAPQTALLGMQRLLSLFRRQKHLKTRGKDGGQRPECGMAAAGSGARVQQVGRDAPIVWSTASLSTLSFFEDARRMRSSALVMNTSMAQSGTAAWNGWTDARTGIRGCFDLEMFKEI